MDNRVKKFFKKYFYFFSFPNFVPKKYLKKLRRNWKSYFNKRDALADLIDEKDNCFNALDFSGIEDAFDKFISEDNKINESLKNLFSEFTADEDTLKKSESSFESMLSGIIKTQEDYNWYGG